MVSEPADLIRARPNRNLASTHQVAGRVTPSSRVERVPGLRHPRNKAKPVCFLGKRLVKMGLMG
jgi:hypothetical protein